MHDGTIMAFIPTVNVKPFTALDTYVGQKIAIWGTVLGGFAGRNRSIQITSPLQLQLLSNALADPKNRRLALKARRLKPPALARAAPPGERQRAPRCAENSAAKGPGGRRRGRYLI